MPFPSLSSLVATLPQVPPASAEELHSAQAQQLKACLLATPRYYLSFVGDWLRICVEKTFCNER